MDFYFALVSLLFTLALVILSYTNIIRIFWEFHLPVREKRPSLLVLLTSLSSPSPMEAAYSCMVIPPQRKEIIDKSDSQYLCSPPCWTPSSTLWETSKWNKPSKTWSIRQAFLPIIFFFFLVKNKPHFKEQSGYILKFLTIYSFTFALYSLLTCRMTVIFHNLLLSLPS